MAHGSIGAALAEGGLVGKSLSARRLAGPGPRRVMALVTGAGVTAALAVAVPGAASAAPAALPANCTLSESTVTCTFGYTGAEQTFTVPSEVTSAQVTLSGASGGSGGTFTGDGAAGPLALAPPRDAIDFCPVMPEFHIQA